MEIKKEDLKDGEYFWISTPSDENPTIAQVTVINHRKTIYFCECRDDTSWRFDQVTILQRIPFYKDTVFLPGGTWTEEQVKQLQELLDKSIGKERLRVVSLLNNT
jgi:hypothetical protein